MRAQDVQRNAKNPIAGVRPHAKISNDLADYIGLHAIYEPFKAIADRTGVDQSTVRRHFVIAAAKMLETINASVPRVLSMDELKIGSSYRCVMTDLERRRPFKLLESHKKQTVIKVLQKLVGLGVVAIVIDMSDHFNWLHWSGLSVNSRSR